MIVGMYYCKYLCTRVIEIGKTMYVDHMRKDFCSTESHLPAHRADLQKPKPIPKEIPFYIFEGSALSFELSEIGFANPLESWICKRLRKRAQKGKWRLFLRRGEEVTPESKLRWIRIIGT